MPVTMIDIRLPGNNPGPVSASPPPPSEKQKQFEWILDAVNPVQHVPGVGQGYRAITGDSISKSAGLVGHAALGALVAGPVGAAIGIGVFALERLVGGLFGRGQAAETPPEPDASPVPTMASASPQTVVQGAKPIPTLNSEQFVALTQAFEGGKSEIPPKAEKKEQDEARFVQMMRENMEKLQRQRDGEKAVQNAPLF